MCLRAGPAAPASRATFKGFDTSKEYAVVHDVFEVGGVVLGGEKPEGVPPA